MVHISAELLRQTHYIKNGFGGATWGHWGHFESQSQGGVSWRHCLNKRAGFSKVLLIKMLTRAHAHQEFRLWGQTGDRDFNFNINPAQRHLAQHDSRADPRMEDQLVKLGGPQARACPPST